MQDTMNATTSRDELKQELARVEIIIQEKIRAQGIMQDEIVLWGKKAQDIGRQLIPQGNVFTMRVCKMLADKFGTDVHMQPTEEEQGVFDSFCKEMLPEHVSQVSVELSPGYGMDVYFHYDGNPLSEDDYMLKYFPADAEYISHTYGKLRLYRVHKAVDSNDITVCHELAASYEPDDLKRVLDQAAFIKAV